MINVSRFGDWNGVQRAMESLGNRLRQNIVRAQRQNAEEGDKIVTKFLDSQGTQPKALNWAPLNPDYKDWKGKQGVHRRRPGRKYSTDIYTMTSTYRRNIAIHYTEGGYNFFLGVRRTVVRPDGENMVEIAYVLEYGSQARRIPARPLWRPTFEVLWPIAQARIRQAIQDAFDREARRRIL